MTEDYTLSQKPEQIGDGKGKSWSYRKYYYMYAFVTFAFIFFVWIGIRDVSQFQTVVYYIALSGFAFGLMLLNDFFFKGKSGVYDTINVEKTPISPKIIAVIAILVAVLFAWRIATTNQAFVPYPTFSLLDIPALGALASGMFGLAENIFFWGLFFPTIFLLLNMRTKNFFVAAIGAILILSSGFVTFHWFVYAINQMAMITTFIFGMLNCILVLAFRSLWVSDAVHFCNNFVASLLKSGVSYLIW